MEEIKKTENADGTTKEQQKRVVGRPFKKGQSGNPKGRPTGAKGFSTLFEQAIKKIAKEKKINIKDAELDLIVKAYNEAKKGNYNFYRDVMDRRYGRPSQPVEHGGEIDLKMKAIEELTQAVKQLAEK